MNQNLLRRRLIEPESYISLKDKHKNENCFIFGSGTSLRDIKKKKEFEEINNHVCISVNSSIILFDWKSEENYKKKYWSSNDSATRLWTYWNNVKESSCKKIIRNSWSKYYSELDKDFLVFSPRKEKVNFRIDEHGLCAVTSIPTSVDLAIFMGCKNIFLLGIDQYFLDNKSYFWQFWAKENQPTTRGHVAPLPLQNKMFRENEMCYKELSEYSKRNNRNIYNCNKNSRVNNFYKIDITEMWDFI